MNQVFGHNGVVALDGFANDGCSPTLHKVHGLAVSWRCTSCKILKPSHHWMQIGLQVSFAKTPKPLRPTYLKII